MSLRSLWHWLRGNDYECDCWECRRCTRALITAETKIATLTAERDLWQRRYYELHPPPHPV